MSTKLDFPQLLKLVYDESLNRLRVDMGANITLGGELEVSIDAASGDNIAISDGTDTLEINPDGSINVNFSGLSAVQITDGTDNLAINPDGSINVTLSGSVTVLDVYNEISSVVSSVLTTIVSYVVVNAGKLKQINVSGTNISEYSVELNATVIDKKRTYFGGALNADFNYDDGIAVSPADTIAVKTIHNRPMVGDFNGRIQVTED